MPYGKREIETFLSWNILEINIVVASPSTLDFKANINSQFSRFSILFIKLEILISSGPTPSIGDINPFKTW